jgi:hypothetical protein
MKPILASDFGNVFVLNIAVPLVTIACVLGATGTILRFKPLAISCGVLSFLGAVFLFLSLPVAREEEVLFTIGFAVFALLAAIGLVFVERSRKK